MPKPNQTMLDQLAASFKSMGKQSPFGVKKTSAELRDPLNYPLNMRKDFDKMKNAANTQWIKMRPERKVYQQGIEARLYPKKIAADEAVDEAYNLRDEYENEWRDAVDEAKENMKEDWESSLDYTGFDEVDPYYLEVDAPSTDLSEYWPGSSRTPQEIADSYNEAEENYYKMKDAQRYIYGPEAWMQEQTMTPRYRNYQRAMQQRQENARVGRLNAAIMNLYRQGYSMPEIREILRNQRMR